jgi:uridine phosphorylase
MKRSNENPLAEYFSIEKAERLNHPADYIEYLKTQRRFKGGLLDNLPPFAILMHDATFLEHLIKIGFSREDYIEIETGTTDPNLIFHVFEKNGFPGFLLNRGMPGAGGAATQVAELIALGVKYIVHIGTCGLVGEEIKAGSIIISRGSVKDAAATMLSDDDSLVAAPSEELSGELQEQLSTQKWSCSEGFGYTIPIFYMQPKKLIEGLIDGTIFPEKIPAINYFEMEQASVFECCRLLGTHAASLVVGSDRYSKVDGQLQHSFETDFDQDEAEVEMMKACLNVFKKIAQSLAV